MNQISIHGKRICLECTCHEYWRLSILQFYSSEQNFAVIRSRLKLIFCPHCRRQGFLILHGYLYGYDSLALVRRGRRIFCNWVGSLGLGSDQDNKPNFICLSPTYKYFHCLECPFGHQKQCCKESQALLKQ